MLQVNWIKGGGGGGGGGWWLDVKCKNVQYGKAQLCFSISSGDTPHLHVSCIKKVISYSLASGNVCPPLITFATSLDPGQDPQNVGPGLEVIKLEFILRLKIKRNDWLPGDTCLQAANHCILF